MCRKQVNRHGAEGTKSRDPQDDAAGFTNNEEAGKGIRESENFHPLSVLPCSLGQADDVDNILKKWDWGHWRMTLQGS